MRAAVVVSIALGLALIAVTGAYMVTSGGLDDGGSEINETGGFFTDCIWGTMTDDDDAECNLFGEENDPGG